MYVWKITMSESHISIDPNAENTAAPDLTVIGRRKFLAAGLLSAAAFAGCSLEGFGNYISPQVSIKTATATRQEAAKEVPSLANDARQVATEFAALAKARGKWTNSSAALGIQYLEVQSTEEGASGKTAIYHLEINGTVTTHGSQEHIEYPTAVFAKTIEDGSDKPIETIGYYNLPTEETPVANSTLNTNASWSGTDSNGVYRTILLAPGQMDEAKFGKIQAGMRARIDMLTAAAGKYATIDTTTNMPVPPSN